MKINQKEKVKTSKIKEHINSDLFKTLKEFLNATLITTFSLAQRTFITNSNQLLKNRYVLNNHVNIFSITLAKILC